MLFGFVGNTIERFIRWRVKSFENLVLFTITTEEEAEKVGQIVATLNLEKQWFVMISWEAPDAEAARERNRAMRAELEQLRIRLAELEQVK